MFPNIFVYIFGNKKKPRSLICDLQCTTMASLIGCLTTLDDPEYLETWIRCFEALVKVNKQRDRRSEGEQNAITEMFNATAGCEAIYKVSTIAYPRNLEELNFKEVGEVIKRNTSEKKFSHRGKNEVYENKTTPRWVYCTIRIPIERNS